MGRPDPAIYSKVLKYSVLPLKKNRDMFGDNFVTYNTFNVQLV